MEVEVTYTSKFFHSALPVSFRLHPYGVYHRICHIIRRKKPNHSFRKFKLIVKIVKSYNPGRLTWMQVHMQRPQVDLHTARHVGYGPDTSRT